MREEIFKKFGIDVEDENRKNLVTVMSKYEPKIIPILEKMNEKQLEMYMESFVKSVNAYKSPQEWCEKEDFIEEPNSVHQLLNVPGVNLCELTPKKEIEQISEEENKIIKKLEELKKLKEGN
jgi:hypothetical protein